MEQLSIDDAERPRRTPRLLAISGGAMHCGLLAWAVADSMRDAGRYWPQWRLEFGLKLCVALETYD